MPSQVRVNSGYPVLPFHVNDVGQDSLFSVTVKSGAAALPAGQTMAKDTASGEYVAYNNGGSGGAEVAKGFLINGVDPTLGQELGSLMVMGVVRSASCAGLDVAGMADLAGHFIFV